MNSAVLRWNDAAGRVMADLNDPSHAIENFGRRTNADRHELHTSLAAMKASISSDIDADVREVLTEVIDSYNDKLTGVDRLAVAAKKLDYKGAEAAMARWQRGIDRQMAALPKLGEAARPFMSDADYQAYQAIVGSR